MLLVCLSGFMTKMLTVFSDCSEHNAIVIARLWECLEEEQRWLHPPVSQAPASCKIYEIQETIFSEVFVAAISCFPVSYSSLKQPKCYALKRCLYENMLFICLYEKSHAFLEVRKLEPVSAYSIWLHTNVSEIVHSPKARAMRDNRRGREGEHRQERWNHLCKAI